MPLFKIIIYLGYLVLAINTFLFFKSYRQKSIAFKIIPFYLLFCLIIQLNATYLSAHNIPNLYLSHYYFVGQFLFLSFFYKEILKSQIKKRVVNFFLSTIPIVIIILYIINPLNYFKFNLIEVILTSLPIVLFSIFYFSENLNSSKKFIYLNCGVFIYLISSTFLFSVGNIVNLSLSSFKKYVWILNAILYLVYQILIFIEWYKNFKLKKNIKNSTFIKHE